MSEKDFWDSVRARQAAGETVDFHTARAAWEAGIPESEVTPEQRTAAKQLNFYRMYSPPDPLPYLHDEYATVDEAFYEEMRALAARYSASPTGRSISAQTAAASLLLRCMPSQFIKILDREGKVVMISLESDLRDVEARLLARGHIVIDSLGFYDKVRDLTVSYEVPAAQWEDGVKVGRDGKPVKPEPYFRRLEKKGRRW